MKNIKNILLASIAALTLVGCNQEEFLKEDPKNLYTKENAFEKASQADATLVRAYIKFNELNGYASIFEDGTSNFLHGNGADVLGGCRGASEAVGSFNNYWNLRTNNGNFNGLWTAMYQLASYANFAIEGLEILEAEEAEETYMMAQARFFRGWAYLRLAECFGGVPIVEKFSSDLKFDYGRATREETYAFAIEDLKFAVANLPATPKQSGRVAQGVANHFLAEAYLGQYAETKDKSYLDLSIKAADAVIAQHPIMTARFGSRSENGKQPAGIPDNGVPRYRADGNTFFDLFCAGNYAYSSGNTESLMIYEQPTYDKYSVNGGNVMLFGVTIGAIFRDQVWSSAMAAEHKNIEGAGGGPWQTNIDNKLFPGGQQSIFLNNCSWGIIMSTDYTDNYVWRDEFGADDRNAPINIYTPVVMDQKSPYYLQECKPEWIADPAAFARVSGKITTFDLWGWDLKQASSMGGIYVEQFGRDWYIARSAETYLLRAEAKYLKGDAAGAAEDINALRARANATKMYSAGEIDMHVILDERARELSYEEMRWPTLLRMGGQGQNPVMKKQLEDFSQHSYDTKVFAGKTFPEWSLFPIPFDVIQLNKDAVLEQNPGWD